MLVVMLMMVMLIMVMLMMVMLMMVMMVMMLMELKRGSMKEKWGLTLVHRTGEGNRIELGVSKVGKLVSWTFLQQFAQVAMFSPAAKAGILPGNTLILINDWKVEAMEQVGKFRIPQYQVTCWSSG